MNPVISVRSSGKAKAAPRRSLLREGESLSARDDSPGSAKRLKSDGGSFTESMAHLHGGLAPTPSAPGSPISGVSPLKSKVSGVNQSPRGNRGGASRPAAAQEPHIKFVTFVELYFEGNACSTRCGIGGSEESSDRFRAATLE